MITLTQQEADHLLTQLGGKTNIKSIAHCVTRLRVVAVDESLVNLVAIDEIPIVKSAFKSAGQIHVVIGSDVDQYFKQFTTLTGLNEQQTNKEQLKVTAKSNMKPLERMLSYLSDIFIPLLPAIITGGLILGFRNVIGDIPLFNGQTLISQSVFWNGVNDFLWLIGEAIFHFLPVGITWSVAKKMDTPPILGIVLGITLVSPQLMNAFNIGKMEPAVWDFGFFQMAKVGYQSQVVPAILAALAMCTIERRVRRMIPGYLYLLVVPFIALISGVFLAHWIIGPIGRALGDIVANVFQFLLTGNFAVIGSAIFGFFYAPLVITGIHHTTNAVEMQLVANTGGTMIFPLLALSNISQASAVMGIIIAEKKNREVSIPAAISAYLGVTEPALYGINLKYKYPMLCAMIGSAIAAALCGAFGVLANGIGVGGLPSILAVQPQFWGVYLIAMLIAIGVPIALTLIMHKHASSKEGAVA